MGVCCISDALNKRSIADLKEIADSNLVLLKAIAIHYLMDKNPGMAVKVVNIHQITKSYYLKVESERSEMMRIKYELEKEEYEGIERAVFNEKHNLSNANRVLSSVFHSLRRKFLLFSENPVNFINNSLANIEIRNEYRELHYKCKKSRIDNRGIEHISMILNGGNELNDDLRLILREICEVTSYLATNAARSVSYDLESPYLRSFTGGIRSQSTRASHKKHNRGLNRRRIVIERIPDPSSKEPKTAI